MAHFSEKRSGPRPTLHVFRSEAMDGLNAFTITDSGATLPEKFGPWVHTGTIEQSGTPPHGLRRTAIEQGIARSGFQLWRRTPTS